MTVDAGETSRLVDRMRRSLAAAGFNILLPLSPAAFDAALAAAAPAPSSRGVEGAPSPPARLAELLPAATGAIIIGSGGRDLFALFQAAPEARDGRPDPLDRYTRRAVTSALNELFGAGAGDGAPTHRVFFPFTDSLPALPFQRLGRAAGIGAPGPLGLQIHPVFGPWWAYRGLVALADQAFVPGDASAAHPEGPVGCDGCDAPCVAACPGGAVRVTGFSVVDCHAHRRVAPECHLSCVARIRCVRGPEHRYSEQQLAFHMTASRPR